MKKLFFSGLLIFTASITAIAHRFPYGYLDMISLLSRRVLPSYSGFQHSLYTPTYYGSGFLTTGFPSYQPRGLRYYRPTHTIKNQEIIQKIRGVLIEEIKDILGENAIDWDSLSEIHRSQLERLAFEQANARITPNWPKAYKQCSYETASYIQKLLTNHGAR